MSTVYTNRDDRRFVRTSETHGRCAINGLVEFEYEVELDIWLEQNGYGLPLPELFKCEDASLC